METTRTIDPDKHFVYTTVTGNITLDEIRADMARLVAEPLYVPDMPGIVDMRNATVNMTPDELRLLTDEIKKSPRVVARTRRALLVSTDRMYDFYCRFTSLAEGGRVEYRVFREEHSAHDWVAEAVEKRRLGRLI